VLGCCGIVGVGYWNSRFGRGLDIRIFDFIGGDHYNGGGIGK